jgi:hypothetical protein
MRGIRNPIIQQQWLPQHHKKPLLQRKRPLPKKENAQGSHYLTAISFPHNIIFTHFFEAPDS